MNIIKHIKRWNKWRKYSYNSPISKFFVLLHVINSPTFNFVFTDEEEREIEEAFTKGISNGCSNIKSKDKI